MAELIYPRDFFKGAEEVEKEDIGFVLMPFASEYRRIYDEAIHPAVEEAGLRCLRADEVFSTSPVLVDVMDHISKSVVVLADLTDRNPNVLYELGLTHVAKDIRAVILLAQGEEHIPFDLRHLRTIIYDGSEAGLEGLKSDLKRTLEWLGHPTAVATERQHSDAMSTGTVTITEPVFVPEDAAPLLISPDIRKSLQNRRQSTVILRVQNNTGESWVNECAAKVLELRWEDETGDVLQHLNSSQDTYLAWNARGEDPRYQSFPSEAILDVAHAQKGDAHFQLNSADGVPRSYAQGSDFLLTIEFFARNVSPFRRKYFLNITSPFTGMPVEGTCEIDFREVPLGEDTE